MQQLVPKKTGDTGFSYDVSRVREDFPILRQKIHGETLAYLDNAATAQKPNQVIEAIRRYYCEENSNIHRGVHLLSERATQAYELAREKMQRFINARSPKEIIFVRGTTEALNLVAQSYGRLHLGEGDEVLISAMEHHSNIVPWQMVCAEKKAKLRVIPITDDGELVWRDYGSLLNEKTKLVALAHVSNALGTVNPVEALVKEAHDWGIPVLLDGAQAAPHLPLDVQALDCDFYAFSGHKLYGPTGIGVLYGKADFLEAMPPYQGGGDMISSVTFEKTQYNALPYKFEAGTPNIAGVVGLGTAIDYLTGLGLESVAEYEDALLSYTVQKLSRVPGLKLIGTPKKRASVVSFVLAGVHAHDVGTILDQKGIAVRTGHHCAMPVMDRFGVPATTRVSLACYNTMEEIDRLVAGLDYVHEVFS